MTSSKKRLAIIILNWNGLSDTINCVSTLMRSSYRDYKLYIIDNGSANNEALALEKTFPDAEVYALDSNIGFCGGCNFGFKKALSDGMEYFMLLNNDTFVPEDMIQCLLEDYINISDIGCACPVILENPQSNLVSFSESKWIVKKAIFDLKHKKLDFQNLSKLGPYKTEFACGCCLLTHRDVLIKNGLLDDRYFAYFDEADWCIRLSRIGLSSYVIPRAKLYHESSVDKPTAIRVYLTSRNRLLWMKENLPLSSRILSFPSIVREIIWNLFNKYGLLKTSYERSFSKAFLLGVRDHLFKHYGKWPQDVNKILLQFKNNT